ncbi:hypothetical protein GCM10009548_68610 [Streptomyces malaysiensis subsp. malaysiensis]
MVDPPGRGRERGPHRTVGERVQRKQHQVVEDGGADDPQQDPEPVAAQQPDPGVPGQREGAQQQHQPQRRLPVQPPQPEAVPSQGPHTVPPKSWHPHTVPPKPWRPHAISPKVSRPTHLVLCTPGAPGTITRAG